MALQFFKSNAVAILYPRFVRNAVAERIRRGATEQKKRIRATLFGDFWLDCRNMFRKSPFFEQKAFWNEK